MATRKTAKARQAVMTLPESMDLVAAAPLAESLIKRRGRDLVLDAGGVQRVGAQCLQVLCSAAKTWEADGHTLVYAGQSARFLEDLRILGVAPAALLAGE